jgi:hypothetical protein
MAWVAGAAVTILRLSCTAEIFVINRPSIGPMPVHINNFPTSAVVKEGAGFSGKGPNSSSLSPEVLVSAKKP